MNAEMADAHDTEPPKTVLVVEDEILIRWVTAQHLRECGYRVVEAGSGDDAVEVLRRSAFPISVVFSDVMMPGSIDGFALAQWVRKHRPDIKVILTSGIAKPVPAADAPCVEAPGPEAIQYNRAGTPDQRATRAVARDPHGKHAKKGSVGATRSCSLSN